MYQLILDAEELNQFRKLAKIEMIRKDISVRELADATGYSQNAIYSFFSTKRASRFIAFAIADYLQIKGVGKSVKDFE